jgi:hypothetical protein
MGIFDRIKMPNIHIPLIHQKAPKEHPADKAIRQATEEIQSGNYTPERNEEGRAQMEGMGLALGMGSAGVAIGDKPALSEFQNTREELDRVEQLGNHPRVAEALEKMRHETIELAGHELIEKNAMLRELTEAAEQKNRWDGQGRWLGSENEEMRYGQILTPQQFYDKLGRVVGKGKIKLSQHVMFPHEGARSGLSAMHMRNPLWDGEAERFHADERAEALKMGDQANMMWREVKDLHKLGREDEAQKKIREITAMVDEAKQKFDRAARASSLGEPEFVRVATIQWPLSTEWMIMDFTEWGTVCKPKFYGWRTALLTMIKNGAITELEAHKAFPLGSGEVTAWYLQQIFDFKLDGGGLIH